MKQNGFAPLILMIVIGIAIAGIGIVATRSNQSHNAKPSSSPVTNPEVTATPQTTTPSSPTTKANQTTTSKQKTTATPLSTTTPTINTNTNTTSSNTNQTQATPTPTTTSYTKTKAFSNSNVAANLSCNVPNTTLTVNVGGTVSPQYGGNGIWTTLTQGSNTIVVSYQAGSSNDIGLSFTGNMTSIRNESPIALVGDGRNYDLKIYSAPYTSGLPTLTNQIGGVSFFLECNN